ncbi:MAG TPA: hypothetical protein PK648_04630 [Verrucomicrobiales bacterium]|nr:hypothetical protein [Verrucomicrobiales bacterium]
MNSISFYRPILVHFLIKQFASNVFFWLLVWLLHFTFYGPDLLPGTYVGISLLIPAAAISEIVFREKRLRSLGGLSRSQLWVLSQREILFVLVALFGVIVMSKDDRISRMFLAVFLVGYTCLVTWMNLVGHRLFRRIHSRATSRARAQKEGLSIAGTAKQ